jgi:hypothetical protein
VNNPLILISGYFVVLFVLVMAWSKIRKRIQRNRKDAQRPILRKIEEVNAVETHDQVMARH